METDKGSFISKYLGRMSHAAPLSVFRIIFGANMAYGIIRFFLNGWVEDFYISPKFHFTFYGFDWVKPIGDGVYIVFFLCFLSAVFIMLGFYYRIAAILFFLTFTYIELLDKTTYLNHYYFISIMSFILIFLPAAAYFSLDAYMSPSKRSKNIPTWSIDSVKIMIGIVYFYAGLAKLNSDWLLHAQPLASWLSTKTHFPLVGSFMHESWFHYLLSWAGCVFDLSIPFLLLGKRTRPWAYIAVIMFHTMTRLLFPIGMFPFIMMGSTIIFFSANFNQKIINFTQKILRLPRIRYPLTYRLTAYSRVPYFLMLLFFIQLIFPFRYIAYPGELFWHEQGFRFSWRVMLIEKTGYTQFKIKDATTGYFLLVDNSQHITPIQEKQMSTQPDFILQYAHYLAKYYKEKGEISVPMVYVESYVSLNGRPARAYTNPTVNLIEHEESFKNKAFIMPFQDKIYGF